MHKHVQHALCDTMKQLTTDHDLCTCKIAEQAQETSIFGLRFQEEMVCERGIIIGRWMAGVLVTKTD